jgi:hypothetical protein
MLISKGVSTSYRILLLTADDAGDKMNLIWACVFNLIELAEFYFASRTT